VNASWSTANPITTSQITSNTNDAGAAAPGTVVYTANTGVAQPITVSGNPSGSRTLNFYNSGILMDTKTITTSGCTVGGWDTTGSQCANPTVVSASIIGQYYPLGTLSLTCSGADHYSATVPDPSTGVPVTVIPSTAYTVPVTYSNISIDGNYTIKCTHGSVSAQVARIYYAAPPAATVNLSITPATIAKGDPVVVKWNTTFPTNACTLTAKVVCANNSCTAAQLAASSTLNTLLTATTTDINDPSTSRSLQTAIKTVAPGHKDNDPVIIVADWKAIGKKTLIITYTTDLTYDCGGASKETKRIQVTKSELQ
jgi:hypothetical protein